MGNTTAKRGIRQMGNEETNISPGLQKAIAHSEAVKQHGAAPEQPVQAAKGSRELSPGIQKALAHSEAVKQGVIVKDTPSDAAPETGSTNSSYFYAMFAPLSLAIIGDFMWLGGVAANASDSVEQAGIALLVISLIANFIIRKLAYGSSSVPEGMQKKISILFVVNLVVESIGLFVVVLGLIVAYFLMRFLFHLGEGLVISQIIHDLFR